MLPHRGIRYQAAIIHEHNVLLIKIFLREDGREIWIFPGGGREPGESEEACVRREVREETHLEVVVGSMLFETPVINDAIYTAVKTYRCSIIGGTARPGVEPEVDHDGPATIRALGWFDLRDPQGWEPQVMAARGTQPLLHQLRRALGYQ
jgi:8-oxo-dGTP diphosphatase